MEKPTLAGLAEKLDALTEKVSGLERENERIRTENTGLRERVAELAGSAKESLSGALSSKPASAFEGAVSRRNLLTKAGAAAVAATAAGMLLTPREARADVERDVYSVTYVEAATYVKGNDGVQGYKTESGVGAVYGDNPNGFGIFGRGGTAGVTGEGRDGVRGISNRDGASGVYGIHTGTTVGPGVTGDSRGDWPGVSGRSPSGTGVQGEGNDGVRGISNRDGASGVYGRHDSATVGPGVTGDGKGNWPGVWGRNPAADAVVGDTSGSAKSGVYGRHFGTTGFGVTGDGKGENGAGVLGRNPSGYGGQFEGGRAQIKMVPGASAGRPTTGSHTRGELYMDSRATLWICTVNGSPGTWRRVTTSA